MLDKSKNISESPFLKARLEKLKELAEPYLEATPVILKFTDYELNYTDGISLTYNSKYYQQRRGLNMLAALAVAYDDDKYLHALEDALWGVCDNFTWALPVHIPPDYKPEEARHQIDLYAAETGFAMSEIYYLLKDKLPERLKARIEYEVRDRIIDAYRGNEFWWEKHPNNWAAVCGGSVGCTYMYMASRKEFNAMKDRLLTHMNAFLSSYDNDGCCREGFYYWTYGFNYFLFFAEMLCKYTNGEIDLLENKKVEEIAKFRQNVILKDNLVVPFADSSHDDVFEIGVAHFLAKRYKGVFVPPVEYAGLMDHDFPQRFPYFIRNFYWYDENVENGTVPDCGFHYFKDAQWFVKKGEKYCFAAKGGHNGEPHNHNDMGNFILFDNGKYIIDDIGHAEYIGKTFGPERYTLFNNCSRGHSLPIINGTYQHESSKRRAAVLEQTEDVFALDITEAYETEGLKTVTRKYELSEDKLSVTDTFEGKFSDIKERLIVREKPTIINGEAYVGDWRISCDNSVDVQFFKEDYLSHYGHPTYVYAIDFSFENVADGLKSTITFTKNK